MGRRERRSRSVPAEFQVPHTTASDASSLPFDSVYSGGTGWVDELDASPHFLNCMDRPRN
eukprot:scaffold4635_cov267-Pinguiococcus_pyrenoidosus.AAC.9